MNSDLIDLLQSFIDFQVKFLVIGGVAVIRYTEPRYTKNLDLLVESTQENSKKVHAALSRFGAPLDNVKENDFSDPSSVFQVGVAPNRIDIFNRIPGVEFHKAYNRKEIVKIQKLEIPFISRDDLISAKLAAGRPQDLVDAGALAKSKNNG